MKGVLPKPGHSLSNRGDRFWRAEQRSCQEVRSEVRRRLQIFFIIIVISACKLLRPEPWMHVAKLR